MTTEPTPDLRTAAGRTSVTRYCWTRDGMTADPAGGWIEYRDPNIPTRREEEALDLLVDGLARKEAAARMGITKSVYGKHLSAAYPKIGATNAQEAVRIWTSRRLLRARAGDVAQFLQDQRDQQDMAHPEGCPCSECICSVCGTPDRRQGDRRRA